MGTQVLQHPQAHILSGSPPSGEHTSTGTSSSQTTLVMINVIYLANHAMAKETTCQLVPKKHNKNHLGMWGLELRTCES